MSAQQPSPAPLFSLSTTQQQAITQACQYIAPNWPLDQMIAVNPFWEMRGLAIEDVAARLATLANVDLLMPRAYYRQRWADGDITDAHLAMANSQLGYDFTPEQLHSALEIALPQQHWHNIADLLDAHRPAHKMAWRDEIIHQISQFCAAHYQKLRPMLYRDDVSSMPDLYQHWLSVIRADKGISIVMDEAGLHEYFQQLPETADELLSQSLRLLELDDDMLEPYAHALLLDMNGWASWVAYIRWQGRLYQQPQDDMLQLLAIRMAWDVVIWRYLKAQHACTFAVLHEQWQCEKQHLSERTQAFKAAQKPLWVWAKALEVNYQQNLHATLKAAEPAPPSESALQAVFCIDVRSEVMRRALEAQSEHIHTFGFAGFFGLPLEYQPADSALKRPQLPGLLKPVIKVSEAQAPKGAKRKRHFSAHWQGWSKAAPSSFSMVESAGWMYALKMLKNSFKRAKKAAHNEHIEWQLHKDDHNLSLAQQAEFAYGVLKAMGIQRYAPKVLLVGHGSHTTNNLHAAGLECGACGGQSGEVNVRVLAQLLNDEQVREQVASKGITIPSVTEFVAALHNTTTDHIQIFDSELDKQSRQWLDNATNTAQRERLINIAPELKEQSDKDIDKAYLNRAGDWSQVRPEWGLANNAAFIVAPRSWTRNANLQGRSFLHDYHWQHDEAFRTLELIMTAPMIVTNWINSQYTASVTDNYKYGSGNKVLHNAVGGNIGIFEGNGGDLRIGLAMQSIHNGERWMHEPLRLSVYIAAPRTPIESIYARHESVKSLVDNRWLNLMRWDDDGQIERFCDGAWQTC
ncbi:DUF2309 domain-containing protein [Pseudoalteromonas sp. CO325X]|uniref:YbcC family protein n=1 Tax=Pseudoalteromonas sp. CO325X TaxID=1777262 RepID=UPI0010235041|nr:DUF2309 domain-containing protein [Pseudoalteromonas sp. CO325X]RZF82947.1 DUF2309 domain-containing protein [Pseudoalteromonas sp. CO325X]